MRRAGAARQPDRDAAGARLSSRSSPSPRSPRAGPQGRFGEQGIAVLLLIVGSDRRRYRDHHAWAGFSRARSAPLLAAIAIAGTIIVNMAVSSASRWPMRGRKGLSAALALGASMVALVVAIVVVARCDAPSPGFRPALAVESGDPNGTRTRVFAVKGRRPRPLDDGAAGSGSPVRRGDPQRGQASAASSRCISAALPPFHSSRLIVPASHQRWSPGEASSAWPSSARGAPEGDPLEALAVVAAGEAADMAVADDADLDQPRRPGRNLGRGQPAP